MIFAIFFIQREFIILYIIKIGNFKKLTKKDIHIKIIL